MAKLHRRTLHLADTKDNAAVGSIRRRLLAWYRRCGRSLPWRQSRDPYAIWVCEIMLQQTTVATVQPYYSRFLDQFPTLAALAAAPLGRVLKAWEGLGYYRRARNLHQAARIIMTRHGGAVPSELAQLLELPGIGRYTAAAIASIAFDQDYAVLDGNVSRVLCRLFGLSGDVKSAAMQKKLWSLAQALLPSGRAGDFNQAMMDLGATVCTPSAWRCDDCPLASHCAAKAAGTQGRLPRRVTRKAPPHRHVAVAVIRKAGRVLIDRRMDDVMLGGLWEFPGGKVQRGESLEQALHREVLEEVGIQVAIVAPLTVVQHTYSHLRVTLHAYICRHVRGTARGIQCQDVKWVYPSQLSRYPFARGSLKIIAALLK